MDEMNFGNNKGPFSPTMLGVVVLVVLGATSCISRLFNIEQPWRIALLLSSAYPLYLIFLDKSRNLFLVKKIQIFAVGTLLIFLISAGTNSTIIGSTTHDSRLTYYNIGDSTHVNKDHQKSPFFKEWFPKSP